MITTKSNEGISISFKCNICIPFIIDIDRMDV